MGSWSFARKATRALSSFVTVVFVYSAKEFDDCYGSASVVSQQLLTPVSVFLRWGRRGGGGEDHFSISRSK